MPSISWGTPLKINEYIAVSNNTEIPKGEKAFVFAMGKGNVPRDSWEKMLNGDLSQVKTQIEQRIPGSKCLYVAVSWESATYRVLPGHGPVGFYDVQGFRIEAMVENMHASLTGAEVISILTLVVIIGAVLIPLAIVAWVTWRVISATEQLGPVVTIGVGLGIIVLLVLLLFVLFGGKAEYRGKKRRFKIGRG